MFGNAVEICLIFCRILGPLVLGWAPNHFVLGAQLAPCKKRLGCIPEKGCCQLQAKVCAGSTCYPLVQACPGKSVVSELSIPP